MYTLLITDLDCIIGRIEDLVCMRSEAEVNISDTQINYVAYSAMDALIAVTFM